MFIQSQTWVALCFVLLCFYFQLINDIYYPNLLWISFFATLTAYNLAYWFAHKSDTWRIPLIFISTLACLYFAFQGLALRSWVLLIILGLISILYTMPINAKSLRQIPGSKIFWIGLVWSLTLFLPWLESDQIEWWPMTWQSLSVLFLVLGITIPFDIRDMNMDMDGLKTIPQMIGIERSIRLATQFLMVSGGLFLISVHFEINSVSLSYLISILISIALVRRSSNINSRWYVPFWIEGLSLLPFLIYHILII